MKMINLINCFFLSSLFLVQLVNSLDNGLARTPPMGWMSWAKFYCEVDCAKHPDSCINEQLYKDMADRMAADGFLDAGYQFVHIDDCWAEMKRDAEDKLAPNRTRFPSGIPALAEYMHKKGLQFGIYSDVGDYTCAGYPGGYAFDQKDAKTFAEWKVDYLKLDGCNLNISMMENAYQQMGSELNKTGRSIVYSCSWPAYLNYDSQEEVNYSSIAKSCNLWRNFEDIDRSWASLMKIINFYNKYQDTFRKYHGPGNWFDPDMIVAGNSELTIDQAKVQMSIWAIWSAPLIMSNDLRKMPKGHSEVMLNKRVIAVDQDPLGIMGKMVHKESSIYVYTKEMTPANAARYSYAIAILNHGDSTANFSIDLKSIGLDNPDGYSLQDLWNGQELGKYLPNAFYNVTLAPTSVAMLKATLPQK